MTDLDRPTLQRPRIYMHPLFWLLVALIVLVAVGVVFSSLGSRSYTTFDYRTTAPDQLAERGDLRPQGTFHTTDLVVDNTANIGGIENVVGNFSVNTNKFTANATTGAIAAAGAGSLGGALNMNTHLIDNVVNPVSAQDAATKSYVDTAVTGVITGSGTATHSAIFTGPSAIGNGWALDDGTSWGKSGSFLITEANGDFVASGTGVVSGTFDVAGLQGTIDQPHFGANGIRINSFGGVLVEPYVRSWSGDPNTHVTADKGSLCLDGATPAFWINTDGATAWTSIATGSSIAGTTTHLPEFTSPSTLGDSPLTDNGAAIVVPNTRIIQAATTVTAGVELFSSGIIAAGGSASVPTGIILHPALLGADTIYAWMPTNNDNAIFFSSAGNVFGIGGNASAAGNDPTTTSMTWDIHGGNAFLGTTVILSHGIPSANHGSLTTGSTNFAGSITGIGSNTSVTLTFSATYTGHSFCTANTTSTSVALEQIVITQSPSAPVFNCFGTATGVLTNCDDFTYSCPGSTN